MGMKSSRPENLTATNGNHIDDAERLKVLEQIRKQEQEVEENYKLELAKIEDDKNYLLSIDHTKSVAENLEGLKIHYRNFSYDDRQIIEKFLDEHKAIDEQDYNITNAFKRFIQASDLVTLEISKLSADLNNHYQFINNSKLTPNFINDYNARLKILGNDVRRLRQARKNQEIYYKDYQNCFTRVDAMLNKLDDVENALLQVNFLADIDLLIGMHRKAKHSFDVMKDKQNETADNNYNIKTYEIEQLEKIKQLENKVKTEGNNFKNLVNALKKKRDESNKLSEERASVKPNSSGTARQQFSHFQPAPDSSSVMTVASPSLTLQRK